MVDFSTYQPPGVYVEEATPALVSVGGVAPSVVAIVGPSIGYRTFTETVTLTGTTPVTLSRKGINVATNFVVAAVGGSVYGGSDYSITVEAGPDGDISVTTDNVTTIARTPSSTIPDGTTAYVTYRYTDAEYHRPVRATDLDDVNAAFGPALDLTTNQIISPLTFAAKFAFDNGASTVVLVATKGSSTATTLEELTTGYAALNGVPDANIVVPLPVGIVGTANDPGDSGEVGGRLQTFIESEALLGNLRIGIVGLDKGVAIDPLDFVDGYRSKRIVHAHPNRMLFYSGASNSTIEVSGFYLAAAYAGRFAAEGVSTPLTKKRIRGFAGIPASLLSTMTAAKKNAWSNFGIAVTELNRQNVLVVRHGTSTDRSSVITREVSLVRARDALVSLIQETLDGSGLIGSFIEEETVVRISGVIEGILETAKTLDFIVDYDSVKTRQLTGDPSVIEVKFRYRPAYPLNYIVVSFSVNTETGDTTAFETTA